MRIDFPDLRAGSSSRLIACGAIQTERRELINWLGVRRTMIASYTRAKNKHYARLLTGGKPKHFHLEVVLATWFPKDMQPNNISKISEIEKIAEKVIGEKIDLNIGAEFRLPFMDLSELGPIRVLSAETQAGGTSIQLTAGVLNLTGSRIHEISWQRLSERDVAITLKARLESTVGEKYLGAAQEMMEQFYKVLVLAQPTSAS